MVRFGQILAIISTLSLLSCQDNIQSPAAVSAQHDTADKIEVIKSKAIASQGTGAPALWKLSDQDTVIFLFGTIHNFKEGSVWRTKVFDDSLWSGI